MELFPPDLDYGYSYIMYFKDGIKMDITLINLKDLNRYFNDSDGLVKILVDKDNLVTKEIVPDDSNYWLKKPTEREFHDCCNEFWSVSTYVAKGVFRREILFALDHFNNILRPGVPSGKCGFTTLRKFIKETNSSALKLIIGLSLLL